MRPVLELLNLKDRNYLLTQGVSSKNPAEMFLRWNIPIGRQNVKPRWRALGSPQENVEYAPIYALSRWGSTSPKKTFNKKENFNFFFKFIKNLEFWEDSHYWLSEDINKDFLYGPLRRRRSHRMKYPTLSV
jgi:hypothetical protein